jgi:hypothetical protein
VEAGERVPDQVADERRTRDLLPERDEQPRLHRVAPVALGQRDVICLRQERHAQAPQRAEASELAPATPAVEVTSAGCSNV